MKKLLIGILVLLLVLVGAIFAIPSFVDWTAYKAEIANRISAMTGRDVALDGDIDLELLPRPTLSVSGARLANLPGATESDMVRLRQLDVRVGLMPLLGGRIQVESVTLVEPLIALEVLADGRRNWDFDNGGSTSTTDRSGGLAEAVQFDQVNITGGTVIYRNHITGTVERADSVRAQVVAGSLVGPFQGQGDFVLRGVSFAAEVTAGRVGEGGALPMRLALRQSDGGAALRFAGIVMTGSDSRLQGDLRLEGQDLRKPLAALLRITGDPPAQDISPALGQAFNLRTAVVASGSSVELTGIDLQIGETRGTGTVKFAPGAPAQSELALAFNRFDLDSWLALAATAPPARPGGPTFRLPADLQARIALSVDALTYNGNVVRQGRLDAMLDQSVMNVRRLAALLPGGADLAASGTLAAEHGLPAADMAVEVNADNLRALLEWLGIDVAQVPADRLRKASLSAQMSGRADNLRLAGIDFQVDTTRLTGGVAYADRGRPGFGTRLEIDRLNLDGYLPHLTGVTDTGEPASSDPARPRPDPGAWLGRFDANLDADIGLLTVTGVPLRDVRVDATLNNGALAIRRLHSPDLAGAAVELEGSVGKLAPIDDVNLSVKLDAPSLAGLNRAFGLTPILPPDRLGPVALTGRVAGDLERLALELRLATAEGAIETGGTLSQIFSVPNWDLKVRATYPDTVKLANLFAPDYRPQAGGLGALDLYAEVAGSPSALSLSAIQGMVGPVSVQGEASIDLAGARPVIQADLQTGAITIDGFRQAAARGRLVPALVRSAVAAETGEIWSTEPIDLGWMRAADVRLALTSRAIAWGDWRLDQPALRARLQNGELVLQQLDGGLLDGKVGLSGRLAAPAAPDGVPEAAAKLTVVRARLGDAPPRTAGIDVNQGVADLDLDLTLAGASPARMVAALSGTAAVTVRDGALSGLDLARAIERLAGPGTPKEMLGQLNRAVAGGQTRFQRLDGTIRFENGLALTDDLKLISETAEATVVGAIDLPQWALDLLLHVTPRGTQDPPGFELALKGPLDRPQRTVTAEDVRRRSAAQARPAAPGGTAVDSNPDRPHNP